MKDISVYVWIVFVSRRLMLHGVQKSRVESCMHRHKVWVYVGKSAELTSVVQLYWRKPQVARTAQCDLRWDDTRTECKIEHFT